MGRNAALVLIATIARKHRLTMITASKHHIGLSVGRFCLRVVALIPGCPLVAVTHQTGDQGDYFTLSISRVEVGLIVFR